MSNELLQYESGQDAHPMQEIQDSGDHTTFETGVEFLSSKTGFEAVVMPNGVLTGGGIDTYTGNNKIYVSAATANIGGNKVVVPSAQLTVTRPAVSTHIIASVIITSGGVFSIVNGTEGAVFSENRGEAGGPAFIAVDAVEVGQVRLAAAAAAPVATTEIFQVPGLHKELALSPIYKLDNTAGSVVFSNKLPLIHVGSKAKKVFASYAEPVFADIDMSSDFVPSEDSESSSSTAYYGGTFTTTTASLTNAAFKAYLTDGISDELVKLKGETLWFRFYPDRYKNNYILEQGKLSMTRAYPVGSKVSASCTIIATKAGVGVEG